jgi:peptide/nickel transport system substrate-binding protein
MKQILEISKEDFYVMGISLTGKGYAIVKNNVHNVPASQPAAYTYPTPGPMQMAQIWKSE